MSGSGRAVWINNSVKKKKAHIIKRGYRNRISSFFAKDGENRRERMKKISAYYRIIQNLTCMGFFFTLIFAVKSFENAVPDEIYVRAGETVSYDFDVPVSVVLKQDSAEVFEYLTKDSPLTYCVNCNICRSIFRCSVIRNDIRSCNRCYSFIHSCYCQSG